MQLTSRWLNQITHKLRRLLRRKSSKIFLALILICLMVRLLPYLAPVRAGDIEQNQLAIQFSDRNALLLGSILTRDQEHTSVVALNQVSPQFIYAILSAEDAGFYEHGALDMKAIFRAIKEAMQRRKVVSGASTITMQLARMLHPSPRTFTAKLREVWLAWRLAAGMNQDEILAAYINRLPMGGNIYGVEAATRTYFDLPASDLNLAQASLLAAIPNNPTYFNPYTQQARLKQRQKYVLDRMVKEGYISSAIAQRISTETVVFQPRQQGIIAAPHLLFWLAKQQNRENNSLHTASVRTTIDRNLQQFVEAQAKQVLSALAANNVHDAAAIVIDNYTGEVLAYVGSPDYFNDAKLGSNDGVQALRQPGSTLKPFVYQLALEKGLIRPNTILADVPTHYAIPGAQLYSPTDYTQTFQGPVRVRIALANSLNIPAVRVLEKVGVQTFLTRLRDLGFTHLHQTPEYYGLGLTLGSGEVNLWELARAYLTIARQGENIPLVTTLPHHPTSLLPSNSAKTWALITDMLSDRYARATAFGVNSVLNLPFPSAVKTGTSSNYRDTWTVGFTTDYTVATWVGNFNGEPMHQVSGVTGAAPLWNRIMLHLHENREPADFPPLTGLLKLPICAVSGLKPTPDCTSTVQEYFYPEDKIAYEQQNNFNLPPEYNDWLAKQQQANLISNNFRIVSPKPGDLFLLYPGEQTQQKLEFKLTKEVSDPVEWWLNGERIATQSANSLFWQLRPGNWTLEARSGAISDKVNFQVQLATIKPNRRGFSLVNPKS